MESEKETVEKKFFKKVYFKSLKQIDIKLNLWIGSVIRLL